MRFADLVGHRHLVSLLSQAIQRETLPPTLLFAGPAGVGKWAAASAVAAAVNCLDRRVDAQADLPVDACGRCRACDRIARGIHVDVLSLVPDDRASIKIDVVRAALERTAFRPFEGRRRVIIVRDADALEPSSQNALLKSLEEPPPGTVFILTSAVPGALLPTVRSRCMKLAFGRLTTGEIATILTTRFEQDETTARATAALANGSVGEALAIGSTDVGLMRDSAFVFLQQAAGSSSAASRLQAAAALVAGGGRKERSREEMGVILRLVASMLRDVELLQAQGDASLLANPGLADDLRRLQRAFAGDRARAAFVAVDRALAAIDRNAGTKVVADWLSVTL